MYEGLIDTIKLLEKNKEFRTEKARVHLANKEFGKLFGLKKGLFGFFYKSPFYSLDQIHIILRENNLIDPSIIKETLQAKVEDFRFWIDEHEEEAYYFEKFINNDGEVKYQLLQGVSVGADFF